MTLIETFFNAEVFWRTLPLLLAGLWTTITLGVVSIVCGSVAGLALAIVRLYAPRPLQIAAIAYIDVFRAIPTLVLLIMIYYALPFVGIRLDAFPAAALALSTVLAAFTAEVCRAGIEAVPQGQFEAAGALGLHFFMTLRKVVLPQAMRIIIPPATSNCISTLKDTALASTVATSDLLNAANNAQALMANPTPLVGAAAIYLILLLPLVRLVGWLEMRARRERQRA